MPTRRLQNCEHGVFTFSIDLDCHIPDFHSKASYLVNQVHILQVAVISSVVTKGNKGTLSIPRGSLYSMHVSKCISEPSDVLSYKVRHNLGEYQVAASKTWVIILKWVCPTSCSTRNVAVTWVLLVGKKTW